MPRRRLVAAALLTLGVYVPAGAQAADCAGADLVPAADDAALTGRATLCLLNQQRTAAGAAALIENVRLTYDPRVGPGAAALIGGPGGKLPYPHEPMPGSRRTIVLLGLLAGALAPATAHAAKLPPATPPGTVKLSNETTTTRWANTADVQPVFTRPSAGARQVTKLRLLTEDSFPEVYLVLSTWKNHEGNTWLKIRVPMRPNGRTGWVRESALGTVHTIHTQLRVNRHTLRVTLYDHGRKRFSAPIGVGKPGTTTPGGHFWIREKFRVRAGTIYGTRAIGTSAYSPTLTDWPGGGVVGLHGTNQPELIPGRPSHGCIRLRNSDIERLYRLAPTGTPIQIV